MKQSVFSPRKLCVELGVKPRVSYARGKYPTLPALLFLQASRKISKNFLKLSLLLIWESSMDFNEDWDWCVRAVSPVPRWCLWLSLRPTQACIQLPRATCSLMRVELHAHIQRSTLHLPPATSAWRHLLMLYETQSASWVLFNDVLKDADLSGESVLSIFKGSITWVISSPSIFFIWESHLAIFRVYSMFYAAGSVQGGAYGVLGLEPRQSHARQAPYCCTITPVPPVVLLKSPSIWGIFRFSKKAERSHQTLFSFYSHAGSSQARTSSHWVSGVLYRCEAILRLFHVPWWRAAGAVSQGGRHLHSTGWGCLWLPSSGGEVMRIFPVLGIRERI